MRALFVAPRDARVSAIESLHQSFNVCAGSKAAKQVFADAEHFAEMVSSVVFPVQLLYA